MIKKCIGLLFLLFLFSCTEKKPLPLANDENVGEIFVRTFLASTSSTGNPEIINTGLSQYLYLGEVDGKKSAILMRFNDLPDSSVIISAKIELISQDTLIHNAVPFDAVLYKSPQHFESLEVTSKDFPYGSWSEEMARATVSTADSDTVVFELDPAWVETWKDSLNNPGFVIATDDQGVARRFGSTSDSHVAPVLNLIYRKESATQDDTVLTVPVADTFIYEQVQTLHPVGPMYIGTGEEYRSILRFDLSQIPDNATINEAEIFLTVDSVNSFLTNEGITINAFHLETSATDPFTADADSSFNIGSDVFIYPAIEEIILDISFMAQQWTRQDTSGFVNNGILLYSRAKYNIFSRVAFFNTDADFGKAPKLTIHYTTPPSYEQD
ncbi:MAG: hypothetical protein DWQ05_08975 [Calditrichaeota bacterium]|nr:MAG: hypothetical protein DWQ05_08975 [Calditrichota bacterium]